ncbi:hypothetical protein [Staphylococcus hominis]|uniref:hypothetical protein n=1 Tax=Staphylococcus hominis TaxID=1290 RepID=UPI0011A23CE6|nr:hypothetical protein [Staphylococcus hominis]
MIGGDNNNGVKIIRIGGSKCIIAGFAGKGLDKELGKGIGKGERSGVKLGEKGEGRKGRGIKYWGSNGEGGRDGKN